MAGRKPEPSPYMNEPVVSKIILAHRSTKLGADFAGYRAIGSDTQGLYHVKRNGSLSDAERSMSGIVIP